MFTAVVSAAVFYALWLRHTESMEKEFIDWLIQNHSEQSDGTAVGLGDDAAVLHFEDPSIVITTDTISDGTHFDSETHSLAAIGHKAIAVSLSDIAAMGAKPVAATVNFTCPRDFQLEDVKPLFAGMWKTASKFATTIVGGDTNRWDGRLVVGSTVIGSKFENAVGNFWTMSGGQPGDQILVSGTLGGSILRKHIEFEPKIDLVSKIATRYQINAATDITDSLTLDLAAVAAKSGCGFCIEQDLIPIAKDAEELSVKTGDTALEHALYDGEDFELIFCVSSSVAEQMLADPELKNDLSRIGKLTQAPETLIKDADNQSRVLQIRGFEH